MIGAGSLNLGSLYVYLRGNNTSLMTMMNQTERRIYSFGKSVSAIGANMTMKLTAPIVVMGTLATREFAKFDQAMTKSISIMKGITPEIRKIMEMEAIRISDQSITSASALAEAYWRMGSAGMNAAQALKSLEVVNKFAIAGHLDLVTATRLAVDSQTALGLRYNDATKNAESLYRVTNVLVKANTLANATVEEYAFALGRYGAAAMKNYNMELEEGVAMLAAYASQTIKGEHAGNMLSRMMRLTTAGFLKNNRAWEQFGINIYDANGKLKPVYTLIQEIEEKYTSLSDKAKVAALSMLGFQARSAQAIFPLMGLGKQMEKFYEELKKDTTFMDTVYMEVMSSFTNQLKVVWNNIKNMSREIGSVLSPVILKFAYRIKEFTEWFRGLTDAQKKWAVGATAAVAAIGPLLLISGKLITSFAFLSLAINQVSIIAAKLAATALGGWLLKVGAAIAGVMAPIIALVAVFYFLRAAWKSNFAEMKEYWQYFLDIIKEGLDYLANTAFGKFLIWLGKAWWDAFTNIFSNAKEFVKSISGLMAGAWAYLSNIGKGHKKATEEWAKAYLEGYDAAEGFLKKTKDLTIDTYESVSATLSAYGQGTGDVFKELWKSVQSQFSEDIGSLISMLRAKLPQLKEITDENIENMIKSFASDEAAAEFAKMLGGTGSLPPGMLLENQQVIADKLALMDEEIKYLGMGNEKRRQAIELEKFKQDLAEAYAGEQEEINRLTDEFIAKQKEIYDAGRNFTVFKENINNAAESMTNVWSNVSDVAVQAMRDIGDGITEMLTGGEFSFRAWAASIIKELIRVMIQAIIVTTILTALGMPPQGYNAAFDLGSIFRGGSKPGGIGPAADRAKFHTGGIVGQGPLKSDERVLVAQTGELIISKDDVASARSSETSSPVNNYKIVNVLEKKEMLAALSTSEGEKVVLNVMRRNKGMISSMMG